MSRAWNAGGPHEECVPVQSQEPLFLSLRNSHSSDFIAQGTHAGLFRKRSNVGACNEIRTASRKEAVSGGYPEGLAICSSERKALERGHGQF